MVVTRSQSDRQEDEGRRLEAARTDPLAGLSGDGSSSTENVRAQRVQQNPGNVPPAPAPAPAPVPALAPAPVPAPAIHGQSEIDKYVHNTARYHIDNLFADNLPRGRDGSPRDSVFVPSSEARPPPALREPGLSAYVGTGAIPKEPNRVTFESHKSGTRTSVTSKCSSAMKMRAAEREAEESLLEIKRKELAFAKQELELERQMVKNRLDSKLDEIEAEGSLRGSRMSPEHGQGVDEWLQKCRDPPTAKKTTDTYDATPRRQEQSRESRGLSPTPTRSRERTSSAGRGIEQLAATIEKMTRLRPAPRQVYELPNFTGALGEWLSFKAAYEDSTKVYIFSATENLARLRSCLKGAARESVAALLHTARSPDIIMKTLEQTYGRPELLIENAMAELRKLPRLGRSATEINNFAVKVQNVVCVLAAFEESGYLNYPLVTREILDKLSDSMLSRWGDYARDNAHIREPQVEKLSKFLMREADTALRYYFKPTTQQTATTTAQVQQTRRELRTKQPASVPPKQPNPVYTTEVREPKRCLCCGGDHDVPQCDRIHRMTVNERWEWAKSVKICFKCFNKKHRREYCRARPCSREGCPHSHHTLLHSDYATTQSLMQVPNEPAPAPRVAPRPRGVSHEAPALSERATPTEPHTVSTMTSTTAGRVLLKMCPVTVRGPSGEVNTFALLDDGSTVTLLDEKLARDVGATGLTVPLKMRGINNVSEQPHSQRVTIQVRGTGRVSHKINAQTVSNLKLHSQTISDDLTKYPHLADLKDACYGAATPQLLIGADNWYLMIARAARTGKRTEPAAVETELGWIIYGSVPRAMIRPNDEVASFHVSTRDSELESQVKAHFDIDALGVSLAIKERPNDKRAKEIFKRTVSYRDGRYEVGLPWISDDVTTPPSYETALTRLRGIERKMARDADFAQQYRDQVNNLFLKGYAEPVSGNEPANPRAWVLPHFATKNINKPGKIRLVFDAACKSQGKCLNDFLLEGPDLLQSLPGILFRFREARYAVTADIQEMFLRVKIRPEDQPSQMFLWREQGEPGLPRLYKMTSMIFGASSSPFLAHCVRNYNAERYANEFPEALEPIKRSHYMDDYVDSYPTEQEAIATAIAVDAVHKKAGFLLRSWNTNCRALFEKIEPERRATEPATLGPLDGPKILGLSWSPETDTLGFNTSMNRVPQEVREGTRPPTKREALSAVMSIYDPLGLLAPYTIIAKLILQDLWRQQIPWDSPLPQIETEQFYEWIEGLAAVAALRIPRCYHTGGEGETRQLHVFVDASEVAYAAVAYWRTTSKEGVRLTLVTGKAKVASLKQHSMPRLELQAAVIGTRLADIINREHRNPTSATFFWSDSSTVLHWIRNNARRYTAFVAHRLGEIAEMTEPTQWHWVPTDLNPADDATRPGNTHPRATDRWYTGPDFLRTEPEDWPIENLQAPEPNDAPETSLHVTTHRINWDACLPEISRFSKHERLIRATACVLAFIDAARKGSRGLQLRHIERAERLWERRSQAESFAAELKCLRAGQLVPRASRLYKLDPTEEDGVLRVRGRINAAPVPATVKRPIILDGRHAYTRLLVLQAHYAAGHATNERVVNDLRQTHWVVNLRPTVRAVARTCPVCLVRRAHPIVPAMGDLPLARIEPHCRPFTNCGVDYFGPYMVTIGRRREKRWVALFTCLTTRAIHLEPVSSLSTDSAIMALRRMAGRRGWPRVIMSDNGTNFHGADNELRAAYEEWLPALREYALRRRAEWRFIPPGAPNQGGAWERLVRSVKAALTATLHTRAPKDEVLSTVLVEAEHTINSRPLTHVSTDPDDPEALTPNHFLLGGATNLPTTGPCDEADRRTWRASQALADHFWARWVKEYLPTLVPRRSPSGGERSLRLGDLVVIVDAALPRNVWPRGVVTRIYPGPDGAVRSADVQTRGGVFRRPTTRLAVLPVLSEAATASSPGGDCGGRLEQPVSFLAGIP